jgi:hypothetical protein
MSILHARVSGADAIFEPPPARVAAGDLSAFLALLRAEGERLGLALVGSASAFSTFEARVCPLALATLSRPFDHDPAVIAVLDEAQFRDRRITIHVDAAGDALLDVSAHADRALTMT